MIESIPLPLVELLLVADPFKEMDLRRDMDFDQFQPLKRFWSESKRDYDEQRASTYDGPRVRFFRDCFREGAHVPAIHLTVDPAGTLRVYNGFHRLCGAILAAEKCVRVVFHVPSYDPKGASRSLDRIRREARRSKSWAC